MLPQIGDEFDRPDIHGRYPLHDAIQHPQCVRALLAAGARVNVTKRGDWSVLALAGWFPFPFPFPFRFLLLSFPLLIFPFPLFESQQGM